MPLLASFIMPHPPLAVDSVGGRARDGIPKTMASYHKISQMIAGLKPDTIIVISPHAPLYADYIHISPGRGATGDFSAFGANVKVAVQYDMDMIAALEGITEQNGLRAGTLGATAVNAVLDHGVAVPLWFVNNVHSGYKAVRISQSGLSPEEHYCMGMCIKEAIDQLGRRAVVIASGDLSHKLNAPGEKGRDCRAFDAELCVAMRGGHFETFLALDGAKRAYAAECGSTSFMILAGILHQAVVTPEFLSYEGTYGVGYAQCVFHMESETGGPDYLELYKLRENEKMKQTRGGESPLVRLARETAEAYVTTGRLPLEPLKTLGFDNKRAGVFVSIKKHGSLRGCIGTMLPQTASIADEIRQNAVSACSRDFRFDPVTPDELPTLTYSVDVLSTPEPLPSLSPEAHLDAAKYGVIVSSGDKRGVLLPDLEGVDTVEEQLSIALAKAGIKGKDYTVERFTVERFT